MEQREKILQQLSKFYQQHARDYQLKKMGLFGSMARGEARIGSDVDVVVEFEVPNLIRQADLMLKLKELFQREVDVVALWKHMNPRLQRRIEQDVIYV
jgi:predicted nucleotidyltransferase